MRVEEPVAPNAQLDAVDEAQPGLTLAEFSVANVCRYTFLWRQGDPSFGSECVGVLEDLATLNAEPFLCVAGWKHDEAGMLRMRHQMLCVNLRNAKWQVSADADVGVAIKTIEPGGLRDTLDVVSGFGLGWFVAFGEWCSADKLQHPPFLETLRFFCWNGRLAPSPQFLRGLGDCGGALAYAIRSDDRPPQVVLVTSERIAPRLQSLVPATT